MKIREVVWVEIEEVKLEHAPVKMKTLPSGVLEFNVSEKVFRELLQTALTSPKELYYVTPLRTVNKNIEIS